MSKFKRATNIFRTMVDDAEQYREHPAEADALARRAEERAKHHHGPLRRIWDELTTFIRMVHSWSRGQYRKAPWRSMAFVLGALLYFVSPIDAIPDFIPLVGFVDDAFVIALVMRAIRKDVKAFRDWEGSIIPMS